MRQQRWWAAAGCAVVLAALAGCGAREQAQVEFLAPVAVTEVALGDVEDRILATGALRAPEVATLTTETAGALTVVQRGGRPLQEGDRVAAGDLLAVVSGEDVALAARTEATTRRYEAAQRSHEAQKRLFAEGLIPEQEVKLAEATLAEVKVEFDRSRLTESRTNIVSPINGVLLRLARDQQGQTIPSGLRVAAGFVVAQVAPTARLIADVDLLGPDAVRVKVGLPARIRHLALSDRTFGGVVARLAPQLDAATRALKAEVEVDNRDNRLQPGMFVEATIVVERREGVVVVPRAAVTERGGVKVIFVLNGQQAARREATLGLGDDERVEVREGVTRGERVVVRGLETLTDGARVRVTGG